MIPKRSLETPVIHERSLSSIAAEHLGRDVFAGPPEDPVTASAGQVRALLEEVVRFASKAQSARGGRKGGLAAGASKRRDGGLGKLYYQLARRGFSREEIRDAVNRGDVEKLLAAKPSQARKKKPARRSTGDSK